MNTNCPMNIYTLLLNNVQLLNLLLGSNLRGSLSGLFTLRTGLGSQHKVPPSETGGVRANEVVVVLVMVVSSGPEWHKVVQRPWELVSRVCINSLEQSQTDPQRNGEQVQVMGEVTPNQWQTNGTHSQKGNLDWVSILSSETERSGVSVMLLVNVLVENTVVQAPVEPVMPSVFQNEENSQLGQNLGPGWEWNIESHTDLGTDGVEKPNRQYLDHEMRHEHGLHTFPLLRVAGELCVLNLVLSEVWDLVDDVPWQTTAKVHDLVHHEEEETGGNDVIVHPVVVGTPDLLEDIECRDLVEVTVCVSKRGDV